MNQKIYTAALFAIILFVGAAANLSAQGFRSVGDGANFKEKGIVVSRDGEVMMMREINGSEVYYVELQPDTKVQTYKKVFRGGDQYAVSYLLRGLRVQVTGRGNSQGHVVARQVDFDPEDLRTAQSLQVTLDPVEKKTAENEARIAAQEENAKRLAGQIEEANALAAQAQAAADRANNRINGLNEYDTVKTIVVPFAVGSSILGVKGKGIIDEAAAWVKTQDRKGWVVAVVGFADSTGNTAKNKTLSEKRANAVIGYLVSKHSLPLTRLVQPFGAGVDNPVASNTTAAGRAQNRRVEIRLLKNKGIAGDR